MVEYSLLILVVEDDFSLCEVIGDMFELVGCFYVVVDGGVGVLKVLGEQVFFIVISDVWMMLMDGIMLFKEICFCLLYLLVVLMMVYVEVDKVVDVMCFGVCDFLFKFFEL